MITQTPRTPSTGTATTPRVGLAFLFGYGLTSLPLLRAGFTVAAVIPIALASDTGSIVLVGEALGTDQPAHMTEPHAALTHKTP